MPDHFVSAEQNRGARLPVNRYVKADPVVNVAIDVLREQAESARAN